MCEGEIKTNRTCLVKRQWYRLPVNDNEDVNFSTALGPGVCATLFVPVQQQLVLSWDVTFLTQLGLPLVDVSVLQPPGLPLDMSVLIACAAPGCVYSAVCAVPSNVSTPGLSCSTSAGTYPLCICLCCLQ